MKLGDGDRLEGLEFEDAGVFTSTSSLPNAFFVSTKSRLTSSGSETAAWTAMALPPASAISASTRSAPFLLDA
jgi:hypothetical protein